jgi:hypothetical protein
MASFIKELFNMLKSGNEVMATQIFELGLDCEVFKVIQEDPTVALEDWF